MKIKSISMSLGVVMLAVGAIQANAMDKDQYINIANATIKEANGGFISNVNQLIAMQEKLVQLGVEGSKDYIKRHPEHADVLGEVVANAEKMKQMTLNQIEDQWHSGKYMRSKGYDLDQFDHFGELFSLMDAIIHPATSYIALKDYKISRKDELLGRASAELIEVVEHVKHIAPSSTMLSEN